MARNDPKKKNRKIIILIGILLLVMILVITSNRSRRQNTDLETQPERTEEEVRDLEKENITAKLQGMKERERMEFYCGMFFRYVENAEYERAYDLLYSEFKQKYFPTFEDFEKYAQETFPEMVTITYNNIERNGEVYILWIDMLDAINGNPKDDKQAMNIVIQENDYNDFVMSFSVI